jgi:hypothetical protein
MSAKELKQIEQTSINSYADWQYAKTIVDNYLAKCKQALESSGESEMRVLLELLDEAYTTEQEAHKKYIEATSIWNKSFLNDPSLLADSQRNDAFVS